jgi:hypothetical protein
MATKAGLTELRRRIKRLGCTLQLDPDGVRCRLVRDSGQIGRAIKLDTEKGLKRLKSRVDRLERQQAQAHWHAQAKDLIERYGYVSDDGGETYGPKGST